MRRLFVVICLVAFAQHAIATRASAGDFDVPTLRGSQPFIPAPQQYARWNGFYAGGQLGQGSSAMNFAGATQSLIAYLLRTSHLESEQHPSEWGVLGKGYSSGQSYGGFVGYNAQFQDAVVGIDVQYNKSNFFANAPVSPITRAVTAGGNNYIVNVSGDASMRIIDYGSARLRAGWAAGNFLPFITGGVALGRADVTRSAQVSGAENPPQGYPAVPCDPLTGCVEFNFTGSDGRKAAFIYGWSAGAGMDVMLMPHFFVRGEFEWLQFNTIQGIDAHIATGRVGAGLKF